MFLCDELNEHLHNWETESKLSLTGVYYLAQDLSCPQAVPSVVVFVRQLQNELWVLALFPLARDCPLVGYGLVDTRKLLIH